MQLFQSADHIVSLATEKDFGSFNTDKEISMKFSAAKLTTFALLTVGLASLLPAAGADTYNFTAPAKDITNVNSSYDNTGYTSGYVTSGGLKSGAPYYYEYDALGFANSAAPALTNDTVNSISFSLPDYGSTTEVAGTLEFYLGPTAPTTGLTDTAAANNTTSALSNGGFGLNPSQYPGATAGSFQYLGSGTWTPQGLSTPDKDNTYTFSNLTAAQSSYIATNLSDLTLYTVAGDHTVDTDIESSATYGLPSVSVNYSAAVTPAPEATSGVAMGAALIALGGLTFFGKKRRNTVA
jgi:hypothetical protein